MSAEAKQAAFEGWAVVEMFGHTREIGFVTTEVYGSAVLFRVDMPMLPAREFVTERPDWSGEESIPAGAKVKREMIPAKTRLIGPGAIYSIIPCTEQTAMRAIEEAIRRPLILLELPTKQETPQLTLTAEPQDRTFSCCDGNPEDGHEDGCLTAEEEEKRV